MSHKHFDKTVLNLGHKMRYKPKLLTFQILGENNFKLLQHLLPDSEGKAVTYQIGEQTFCLTYLEQTQYTSLVSLTWDALFGLDDHHTVIPSNSRPAIFESQCLDKTMRPKGHQSELLIRLYYDAKLAEVLAKNRKPYEGKYPYPNMHLLQVDEKERLNLFLYEWLRACILMGKK